jgi:hypothetical protein
MLVAFLFVSAIGLANNNYPKHFPHIERPLSVSKTTFCKKEAPSHRKHGFRFINQINKNISFPTYIKFGLKNEKGKYLTIKIGYIS